MTSPTECPRYEHCNCPLCPLDADYQRRSHLRGEPVCLYLREAAKQQADHLEGVPEPMASAAPSVYRELMARPAEPIQSQLRKAAKKGSRIAIGKGLKAQPKEAV